MQLEKGHPHALSDDGFAYVYYVIVFSGHRRKGYGRQLMLAAEVHARQVEEKYHEENFRCFYYFSINFARKSKNLFLLQKFTNFVLGLESYHHWSGRR